jgi:hypothetical protein
VEDQKHLGRPGADALDLDQLGHHVAVGELRQARQVERPALDPLRQVAQEADLGPRKARLAKRLRIGRDQLRRLREGAAERGDQALPDRAGRLGRKLLADDRSGQRLVGIGAAATPIRGRVDGAALVDQPPEDVIDRAQVLVGGGDVRRAG